VNHCPAFSKIIQQNANMQAYQTNQATTLIDNDNSLFFLTYSPTFKIEYKGKVNNKYRAEGKAMKISRQQEAIFKNIIKVNFALL
jgi:signal transduction protein with GAF and PtsI domain